MAQDYKIGNFRQGRELATANENAPCATDAVIHTQLVPQKIERVTHPAGDELPRLPYMR